MNLRLINSPTEEVISLATAKLHLRVDHNADDALITSYIKTAREVGEGLARMSFFTETWELVLDDFPSAGFLKLPRPPLQFVSWVKYLDINGNESTWTDYAVDARSEPGVIKFKSTPAVNLFYSGAVSIRFVSGFSQASDVPNKITLAMLLAVGYWYENREAVGNAPDGAIDLFVSERTSWF